ncbi:hypothetical protein OPKNFCMD_5246 [Methylobacterium crusticola]|uniref:Uncharacterized protein n=1 Tax=Methylobacterium crusticola TaxID=1697972 RepID=A0ABQ4R6D2_9HYPH|nr:hypothetical protein OPKNFCMD_5246 [Methylobacterium crusticola]
MAVRLVAEVGPLAARVAVEAGASLEVAFVLDQLVAIRLDRIACHLLVQRGYDGFRDVSCIEHAGRNVPEIDWQDWASRQGVSFDPDAAERLLDQVMFPTGKQTARPQAVGRTSPC